METKKLLVNFCPGTSAFERNKLIRWHMTRLNFNKIVCGVLININGVESYEYYDNRQIENATKMVIHYH